MSIALMSRPLANYHRLGSQSAECSHCGHHQPRVGVDRISWEVIDQIRLEHHRLATHIDLEEAQSLPKDLVKLFGVLLCVQDRDSGSLGASVEVVFRQKKGSTN